VAYNNERTIRRSIESILSSSYTNIEIIVIDNGSKDRTLPIVRSYGDKVMVTENTINAGFAGAMNQGISKARGEFILSLNPDAELHDNAVTLLLEALEENSSYGAASPKLLRKDGLIDCAGIDNELNIWFRNRGEEQSDAGQYDAKKVVFGASGACAMYKMKMLEDIKIDSEYFDNDFFAYKEDVDLSWRANRLGWKTIYEPSAVARHERNFREFIPSGELGRFANLLERIKFTRNNGRDRHYNLVKELSFRNNIYMYMKNYDLDAACGKLLPVLPRMIAALLFYIICLPSVFCQSGAIIKNTGKMLKKRRFIRSVPIRYGV